MSYLVQISDSTINSASKKMKISVKTSASDNIKFGFKMEMTADYSGVNTGDIELSGQISSVHKFRIVPAVVTSSPGKVTIKGIIDNTDSGLSSFDIIEKQYSFRIIDAQQTEIAHWDNLTNRENYSISLDSQNEYYLESEMKMELLWQSNPLDAEALAEIYFLEIIEP